MPKDLGLGDSLVIIETELRKAFEKEHLFDALIQKLDISNGTERERLKNALITSLKQKNENQFAVQIKRITGKAAEKGSEIIIARLFTYFTTGT